MADVRLCCFYNLQYYLNNPLDIIRIWDSGMAFHGGFLGVVISVIILGGQMRSTLVGNDLIALSSPRVFFFGRLPIS